MTKFSNSIPHNSPDGLSRNPYPVKPITQHCVNQDCDKYIDTEICPFCGTENEIEFYVDYEAGEKEFDPDELSGD